DSDGGAPGPKLCNAQIRLSLDHSTTQLPGVIALITTTAPARAAAARNSPFERFPPLPLMEETRPAGRRPAAPPELAHGATRRGCRVRAAARGPVSHRGGTALCHLHADGLAQGGRLPTRGASA